MEKYSGLDNAVLLLDNYNDDSIKLHKSMRIAGFTGPVVVLEDNGFLPDDVISIYQYFCGFYDNDSMVSGKPKYFNQINVPDFWEISGNNSLGKVHDRNIERGRIFYAEPKHRRLVNMVDWLDEKGIVRSCDHYNKDGILYARTTFDKSGKKFCRSYFDINGREVIVENYVTKDIILNRDGKVFLYKNLVELTLKLIAEIGAMNYRLYYNSLSTPLFVSERMPRNINEDVLFWQEDKRDDIPGNMQMILNGQSARTKAIYVQKRDSFRKLSELSGNHDMINPLGFIYEFKKDNKHSNQALICTNSDNIEKCEDIITGIPDMHFHIAALTEMSSKLMNYSKYKNVTLYPGARVSQIEALFDKCDYYLDINHEGEIVSAVEKAFLNNNLIIGFNNTLHNRLYISEDHIFNDSESMISFINTMMDNPFSIDNEILKQKVKAMAEDLSAYSKIIERIS